MGSAFHKTTLKENRRMRSPSLYLQVNLINTVETIASDNKMTPSCVIRLMIHLEHEANETRIRILANDQKTA